MEYLAGFGIVAGIALGVKKYRERGQNGQEEENQTLEPLDSGQQINEQQVEGFTVLSVEQHMITNRASNQPPLSTAIDQDRALGSILGAAVGNMVGSQLSDMDFKDIDENIVNQAMAGNKGLSVQFEPSVFMLNALNEGGKSLDLGQIKKQFFQWHTDQVANPDVSSQLKLAFQTTFKTISEHYKHVSEVNQSQETNECMSRLVPFAIWCSNLESNDDLFEAVRLYCSFTHTHELVLESCYLYCYAIKLLIVEGRSMNDAYNKTCEESARRAEISGFNTIIHWFQNDVDIEGEMPIPHYRPLKYVKVALCWAFYYLKHEYQLNDALKDIISKGGDTMSNAAIVGGLIGAARGIQEFNKSQIETILKIQESQGIDEEFGIIARPKHYQLGSVLSLTDKKSVFHKMVAQAPQVLKVKWDDQIITGARDINDKYKYQLFY